MLFFEEHCTLVHYIFLYWYNKKILYYKIYSTDVEDQNCLFQKRYKAQVNIKDFVFVMHSLSQQHCIDMEESWKNMKKTMRGE